MALPVVAQTALTLTPVRGTATVVVSADAPIFVVADEHRAPVRVAKAGSVLGFLGENAGWYNIEFDDPQYGRRVGYIQAKYVRDSRLDPIDLSVRTAPPPLAEAPKRATGTASPTEQRAPAGPKQRAARPLPQDAGSRQQERNWWLDVNFGVAKSADGASLFVYNTGLIDVATFYGSPPRGSDFDFGGGFMVTPVVGFGLNFSGTAHRDIVGLGAGVGTLILASGATDELTRSEGALNIQAMIVPINSDHFRGRLFGGPSFIRYQADMVDDFFFFRSVISNVHTVSTEGSAMGFHVGGDATYFFSRFVGLGGFARYSRATASIDEPMSGRKQNMLLGGVQTGGGLRFRF